MGFGALHAEVSIYMKKKRIKIHVLYPRGKFDTSKYLFGLR